MMWLSEAGMVSYTVDSGDVERKKWKVRYSSRVNTTITDRSNHAYNTANSARNKKNKVKLFPWQISSQSSSLL